MEENKKEIERNKEKIKENDKEKAKKRLINEDGTLSSFGFQSDYGK